MDPIDYYDAQPVRTGAAPTLNIPAAGLTVELNKQPIWEQMTGVFVRWMQWHFASATRIEHPQLIDKIWTTDTQRSPIQITSLAHWNPKNTAERPAILVDTLDQQFDESKMTIGDNQFQGIRRGSHCRFMMGSHVLHCLGGREGEASILAWEVWRELVRFAPYVRQSMCLYRLQPQAIGKRTQIQDPESREHYTIPIVVKYNYQEAFRVFPLDEAEITGFNTYLGAPP